MSGDSEQTQGGGAGVLRASPRRRLRRARRDPQPGLRPPRSGTARRGARRSRARRRWSEPYRAAMRRPADDDRAPVHARAISSPRASSPAGRTTASSWASRPPAEVDFTGIRISRFRDGRIVEEWEVFDAPHPARADGRAPRARARLTALCPCRALVVVLANTRGVFPGAATTRRRRAQGPETLPALWSGSLYARHADASEPGRHRGGLRRGARGGPRARASACSAARSSAPASAACEREQKLGSMRFGLVLTVIIATAVVVTIAMFQALYIVMG